MGYYNCRNLVLFYQHNKGTASQNPMINPSFANRKTFNYDAEQEETRRRALSKLLRRSQEANVEVAQCAESYHKHQPVVEGIVQSDQRRKRRELERQSLFIIHRQEMSSEQIEATQSEVMDPVSGMIPFGRYQGFGTVYQDTLSSKDEEEHVLEKNLDKNILDLPPQCIPSKVRKVRKHIRLVDQEDSKHKYELKMMDRRSTLVVFPPPIKEKKEQSVIKKGRKGNSAQPTLQQEEALLTTANPDLGLEIARRVQKEMVKKGIMHVEHWYREYPMMDVYTNATRAMVDVLRRDYIKYFALKTMVNDLKKQQRARQS